MWQYPPKIAERQYCFNESRIDKQSDDIIVRMEKLCAAPMKRPRILLNDMPLDTSLNKTLLSSSDGSLEQSNIPLPDMEWKSTQVSNAPQPIWKSYDEQVIDIKDICCDLRAISFCRSKNTSLVSLPECETSAYYSGRSSSLFQSYDEKVNESYHSCSLPDIATTDTSAYGSGHDSSLQASDSLYHYRRGRTPPRVTSNGHRQQPSTPTSSFKLDPHELSCELSPISNMTRSPVTSSLNQMHAIDFENLVEPDDLNDTLERVNYRLAVCGAKSPSPTKMARKRQLMQVYFAELLQQGAATKVNTQGCNGVAMQSSPEIVHVPTENKGLKINSDHTDIANNISTVKDIENHLISLGCNSPTPYSIAKRRQLIEEMAKKSKSKSRIKRTISVEQALRE